MKIFLGITLAIALFIIGFLCIKSYKEQHKLARTVRRILQIGFIIVFANLISLLNENETVCLVAYSLYFAASDWLLYYLLKFSIEYIGNPFEKHVNKVIMFLLLLADCVSIVVNNVSEHLYSLNRMVLFGDEVYYELSITPWFFVHYGIVLMLAAFCLISLFYRSVHSPVFYRKKYLTVAIIMVVLVIMNIFSVTSAIDVSVIGYVVEAICIYYCVFVFSPQKLLSQTLAKVTEDISVGLLLFDVDGNKLYKNKLAEQLIDEKSMCVDDNGVSLEQWCSDKYNEGAEDFVEERIFYRADEELTIRIQLQRMFDVNDNLQGAYFVIQDRTEEIKAIKREQYMSTHDSLTGLYNKEHFCNKAERYIKSHHDETLYVICTDIKDFKIINDFLGSKTADVVLTNYANMIRQYADGDMIYGRLGNDVFGMLMNKSKFDESYFIDSDKAQYFAGVDKDISFPVVNYIGVYEVIDKTLPVSVMCDRARMSIATIKGDYHKRVAYYNEDLRERVLHEQELISGLDEAIKDEQLKMYLQPQMSSEGKLLGAEALVRWFHPVKGQIMPNDFIPIFEKNGLISDIDRYMWEVACRILKRWKELGREDLYISVNISPRDFYFLNIFHIFTELVEQYDIDPKNLKLEITETAIVMDFNRQMELISRLRNNGFVVEMDDFGSGYSSLNLLKDLHVDVLKIDMAFLKKANDEERSKKILQMVIELSNRLDMPVITEGVESEEQVKFLTEMGCHIFQGYYFSRPLSIEEFEAGYVTDKS